MTQLVVGDVGSVAVTRVGRRRRCATVLELLSLDAPEALPLEERAVGLRADGDRLGRSAVRLDLVRQRRLVAIVVHAGDPGDVRAGRIIDGWICGIRAVGGPLQAEVVDLDVEGLLDRVHASLHLT
jgi:hypothetical protein